MNLSRTLGLILALLIGLIGASCSNKNMQNESKIKVMLLTGVANKYHSWELTSAAVERHLDAAGIFEVDVVVCPDDKEGKEAFSPDWSKYDVVYMVYDDGNWALPEEERSEWSRETKDGLEKFVREGGGLVVQHGSDNCFPDWKEFNEMIAVGGWGGRDENSGPAIAWKDGGIVYKNDPGGAKHPPKHDFQITVRDLNHPITEGMPEVWMHPHDEIYCDLRGPAKNVSIIATAYADPNLKNGTGEHEPVFMTIAYGEGRVFHNTLGHAGPKDQEPIAALDCVGFMVSNQRGTEWAATGKVTIPIPDDFPTADKISVRKF